MLHELPNLAISDADTAVGQNNVSSDERQVCGLVSRLDINICMYSSKEIL